MKNLKISPRLALGLVVAAFLLLAFGLYKTFAHPAEVTDTNALASEIQANNPNREFDRDFENAVMQAIVE